MKSRIRRRQNVRKSIRRCQSGGEKTYKFSFEIDEGDSEYWDRWVSSKKRKYWESWGGPGISTYREDIHAINLEITVKEPKEGSFFQKERKEYLYDFQILLGKKGSNRVIERFAARFNKKNVTANELAMSFFQNIQGPDTYSDFVSNDLLLVSELINTLQFAENVSSGSPDKIYLVGLYILFVELEKKLKPITDAIAERDAADAKKKTDYAMTRMQDLHVSGKRTYWI
jgi:hypothetical protein